MKITFFLFSLITVIASGCSKSLPPSEYQTYIEKNKKKYSYIIERNGIQATIVHYPSLYYSARNMLSDPTLSLDSAINRYKESLFFVLSVVDKRREFGSVLLEKDGIHGLSQNILINSFERNNDIYLLNGKDTMKMANYQYERNWGMTNEDMFVLTFPSSEYKHNQNLRLRIRDITLNLGTIEIPIKKIMPKSPNLRGL